MNERAVAQLVAAIHWGGETVELPLPDGRAAFIYSLTYGRARLGVGKRGARDFHDTW